MSMISPPGDDSDVATPLSVEAARLLAAYRDLLAEGSQRLSLTSLRTAEEVERRHIRESLALLRAIMAAGLLPHGARMIDVGSGGGLPGIPMAIVRPDICVTLLEATGKKAAFLREAVSRLGLPQTTVVAARAEEAAHDIEQRDRYDLAVARAVAALAALVELSLPFVRIGGALAAVKGSQAEEEIAAARGAIDRCGGGTPRTVLLGDGGPLRIVIVPKVTVTPPELPRRPGMPAKRPLR